MVSTTGRARRDSGLAGRSNPFRPTGVDDPHVECCAVRFPVRGRGAAHDEGFKLGLKPGDKGVADDQACLRQEDYVANVAIRCCAPISSTRDWWF